MENNCLESGGVVWGEGGGSTPGATPRRLESPSLDVGHGVYRPAPVGTYAPSQFLPSRVPLWGSSQGSPRALRARELGAHPHSEP